MVAASSGSAPTVLCTLHARQWVASPACQRVGGDAGTDVRQALGAWIGSGHQLFSSTTPSMMLATSSQRSVADSTVS